VIFDFFFLYSTVIYRLTLFFILARELHQLTKQHMFPSIDEAISQEQQDHFVLVKKRDQLRTERVKREYDLTQYGNIMNKVEVSLVTWYGILIPELEKRRKQQQLLFARISQERKIAEERQQVVTLQKKICLIAFAHSIEKLKESPELLERKNSLEAKIKQFSEQVVKYS
jgi:hypothetical protein